jgi:hypothetical protein
MKSEITVRTQGIKGGDAKFTNVGCTTIYATDKGQTRNDLVIDLDSFTGSGRDYQRRDNTLINITFEGQPAFNGTIQQLVAKLNPNAFYSGKALKIKRIKDILGVWGATSCAELNRDHSPCKNSIGEGKSNVSELIEQFDANGVSAVTYNDELEIGWNDYNYEDLSEDLIDEIADIIDNYETDMLKTESRCQD